MPITTTSFPGVNVREFDFSDYVRYASSTVYALVGVAGKGPLHASTLCTSEAELISIFGAPPDMTLGNNEQQLLTLTPTGPGAMSGSFELSLAGPVATGSTGSISFSATASVVQTAISIAVNTAFGISGTNVSVTGATGTAGGMSMAIVFVGLLAQRNIPAFTVTANPTFGTAATAVARDGTTAPGDFALHSALQFLRQGRQLLFVRTCQLIGGVWQATIAQTPPAGLATSMRWNNTTNSASAIVAAATSAGEWANGVSLRVIKTSGAQNERQRLSITGVGLVGTFTVSYLGNATVPQTLVGLTVADFAAALQTAVISVSPGATVTVVTVPTNVNGSSTGFDVTIAFGGSLANTDVSALIVTGTNITGTLPVAAISVVQQGAAVASNVYRLEVLSSVDNSGTVGVVESFERLMLVNDAATLAANDAYYWLEAVNNGIKNAFPRSQFVKFTASDFPTTLVSVLAEITATTTTFPLSGGFSAMRTNAGTAGDTAAAYVGTALDAGNAILGIPAGPTGLQIFSNAEAINIDLIAVPGVTLPAVLQGLTLLADGRGECTAILDTPSGLTADRAVAWHNNTDGTSFRLNSSYTVCFWPWQFVNDTYNRKTILVPPSCLVPAAVAKADVTNSPWSAVAGSIRGLLPASLGGESPTPPRGALEAMYTGTNAINVIIDSSAEGPMIYGNRTTQRRATSLDRWNVRRLMNYLKKVFSAGIRSIVFDPNDSQTWERFLSRVTPVMRNVQAGRGVYDFKVICDESTNPALQVDNNVMRGIVLIKPTKTAEVIYVDLTLLSTGADFVVPNL